MCKSVHIGRHADVGRNLPVANCVHMSIRLRPHHLLCALTFAGEGYTAEFIENFRRILLRLDAGEAVVLVDGPDDVCAPLAQTSDRHCLESPARMSDELALDALRAELDANPESMHFDAGVIAGLRRAFADGRIRSACTGCSWHDLCSRIAANEFHGVVLPRGDG